MNKIWTQQDINLLEEYYKQNLPRKEIAKKLGRSECAIINKAQKLGINDKYVSKFSNKYKAIYQDSEWLLNQVLLGKEPQEIADELQISKRVIEKWLYEKNHFIFREVYKLSDIQRQIVVWGTLGDGHIDKRDTQPLYIESHSIEEKDYLFWKYKHMKPMFNSPPVFHVGGYKTFSNNKTYYCKDYYRMSSKIINDLITIRDMSKFDKIKTLNELGLSLYILDDGYRNNSNWELCVASLSEREKELFIQLCKERFKINGYLEKDIRYIRFDSVSSLKIDDIILSIFDKNMDIIQKKIIKHRKDL